MDKGKKRETEVAVGNTIFDDVFRTIVERIPQLVIPLINEVLCTDYPEEEEAVPIHNEHQTKSGEIITDSCLLIRNHLYHIECQSHPDTVMAVRMIEYDFAIALENVVQKDGMYEMEFPRSCTLYLRDTKNTPDELQVKVHFRNGTAGGQESIVYTTPIIKVKRYTKDEIFQKKLLLFLPFYIMRYENSFRKMHEDSKLMEQFLSEYEDIRIGLENECTKEKKVALYTDLMEFIIKISDYMLESEKELRERIGEIMGGQVLKLRSEELREEGLEEGMEKGMEKGIQLAKQVLLLYGKGKTPEMIAVEAGISIEKVKEIVSE